MKLKLFREGHISIQKLLTSLKTTFVTLQGCEVLLKTEHNSEWEVRQRLYIRNSGGNVIEIFEDGFVFFEGRRSVVMSQDTHSNLICHVWGFLKESAEKSAKLSMSWKEFAEGYEIRGFQSQEPERPWYC